MKLLISSIAAAMLTLSLCQNILAQDTSNFQTFVITIPDSDDAPIISYTGGPVGGIDVAFDETDLNDITDNYVVRQFHLAFPNTTDTDLEDVYLVEVNDIEYMDNLLAYDTSMFKDGSVAVFQKEYLKINNASYVPTYQYQNYISTVTFTQSEINTLMADYTFNSFELAFPNSTDPSHTDVYLVSAYGGDVVQALADYNGTVFVSDGEVTRKRFLISVTDKNFVPTLSYSSTNNQAVYTFGYSASVQAIANKYNVFHFSQAFPHSELEHLRQMYLVECNDLQFMYDLISFNDYIFPYGDEAPKMEPLYTPNDYGANISNFSVSDRHHNYLDLIRAEDAWTITKGKSTEQFLAINDWYVDWYHDEIGATPNIVGGVQQGNPILTGSQVYDWHANNKTHFYKDNNGLDDPAYYLHGTAVFGLMSGATDNNLGLSSIGFNTKIGILSHEEFDVDNVLDLSRRGYRVVNCSWGYGLPRRLPTADKTKNTFYPHTFEEDYYNEVYNNGTVAVFGAGNGGPDITVGPNTYNNSSYSFPASYNHNLSITSVGSDVPSASATDGSLSVIDEHTRVRETPTDPADERNHHHNDLVDLCAPGYTVHILNYHRNLRALDNTYLANKSGTSFAAPLVSGTIGLMLSVNDCLTPYQIEYLLKTSANSNIYNLPANAPFVTGKQIGEGRLDAEAAVQAALGFKCNAPEPGTETMYIEEIEINHRCWDGNATTSNIILNPIVKNGNNDYEYRWTVLSNNNVTIDDYYAKNPKVIASVSPHQLYYLLTVKEKNKAIPRVASKRIKVQLITDVNKWDLAIKDSYHDHFREANDMDVVYGKNWDYWSSPWIWNTFGSSSSSSPHMDPEYSSTTINYLHVKVQNVGCATSPSQEVELKAYWTLAAAGKERWPIDWTTAMYSGPNGSVPQGEEITSSANPQFTNPYYVSALNKGGTDIITIPWEPIDPADYTTTSDYVATCLLARLYEHNTTTPPKGLNETVYTDQNYSMRDNIRNNNNIATINWFTTDFTSTIRTKKTTVFFGSEFSASVPLNLQLINQKDIRKHLSGDMSEYLTGTLYLGDLYAIWADGGYQGNAVTYDDNNETVFYDPSVPLYLENIILDSGEIYPVEIELTLRDGITVPEEFNGMLHFRQTYIQSPPYGEEGEDEEIVTGAVSIRVAIDTMTDTSSQGQGRPGKSYGSQNENIEFKSIESSQKYVTVYPNPASKYVRFEYSLPEDIEKLGLIITNVTGQIVSKQNLNDGPNGRTYWDVGVNPPGIYIYKIIGENGVIDIGRIVVTK